MTETWRQTTLHPMYEVSDQGNVRRRLEFSKHCILRPLKPYEGRNGYPKVQLGFRGPRAYVHALVAEAFLGPRPPGHDVDHIDHDRTNNAAANLRYLTSPDNRVVWGGRDSSGRIIWITKYDLPPEDHVPMTEEELHDYDPTANGW